MTQRPMYETVLYDVVDHVATITVSRPDRLRSHSVRNSSTLDRLSAQEAGWNFPLLGNPIGKAQLSRESFAKPTWTLR